MEIKEKQYINKLEAVNKELKALKDKSNQIVNEDIEVEEILVNLENRKINYIQIFAINITFKKCYKTTS